MNERTHIIDNDIKPFPDTLEFVPEVRRVAELEEISKEEPYEYVYELVDCTDVDTYFTIGVWSSLDKVLDVLKNAQTPFGFNQEDERLEVRKRKIGQTDYAEMGETVLKAEILENREDDCWIVKIKEVPSE